MKNLLISVGTSGKTGEVLLLLAEYAYRERLGRIARNNRRELWRDLAWELAGNKWITTAVAGVLLKDEGKILEARVCRTLELQAIRIMRESYNDVISELART